jgi:hypothetical protein
MITLSFGTDEVVIRGAIPSEDSREYDQSMIVRRTRNGQLIQYRDANWHDFDTIAIRSKANIRSAAEDARDLIQDSWGQVITMDVDYGSDSCVTFRKRFTGIVITPSNELITVKDQKLDILDDITDYGSYDISFEFLIETEDDLPPP